ncbi:NAD(P)H-hydrate dehydratase [Vibrio sp. SCSIO 43137]|uniref:NAD(P)H-hydrate dehydratase n=1 Tax=Vibrio sp. SCSIO 43137 TaxID=3021011 RepID=UPI0023074082|nr:NAD(P)H-hydrate dehydratase [Vibrio sp. SCSIO 43137]WCE31391.1 NAD(P)H-hydrate dehydratase [Vibrio sp. SCSIO 43137]
MNKVSEPLYLAAQVREGERQAAAQLGIEMFELMERAGLAVYQLFLERYSDSQNVLVICGGGNNGGDGYIFARLAKGDGYNVTLWQSGKAENLTGDAAAARDKWLADGGNIQPPESSVPEGTHVIIDALLGTGLHGAVRPDAEDLISIVNESDKPVISVDSPSGLHSDSGAILGSCIRAEQTVTFIARKQGLYTGEASSVTGEVIFAGLGVSEQFHKNTQPSSTTLSLQQLISALKARGKTSHKGDFGRVVLMGGDRGMFGAIRLASEACARTGAGLTRVVTQLENVSAIVSARPELMVYDWRGNSNEINNHLHWADVIALGPGMGTTSWARSLLGYSNSVEKPIVLDADGLNLLAKSPDFNSRRIITPHPGEAARLLNCSIDEVEQDRFSAVKRLQRKYGGVAVLKGAGTLVFDGKHHYLCTAGNPGMATGGMGDVLTGVIAGLLGQGLSLTDAACGGVWMHSTAADMCAAEQGQNGMLASDLFPYLRKLVNQ